MEGISLPIGTVMLTDGNCPGITVAKGRYGRYILSKCMCCPEHIFWRHESDPPVCFLCYPATSSSRGRPHTT